MTVGDVIVRIETKSVQDIRKEEILDLLNKQAYRPLEIGFLSNDGLSDQKVSEDYLCTFEEGEPLGVEIGDLTENGTVFVEIVAITPGGVAEKNSNVSISDRIVRVGSKLVSGKTLSEVVDLVRIAPRPLEIGFSSQKEKKK